MVWVNTDTGVYHKPGSRALRQDQSREVHDGSGGQESQLSRGEEAITEPPDTRLPAHLFSDLFLSKDDFAVAHQLVVQPKAVLIRGRLASGARRATEQAHAGGRLKDI
jgi:hypothetical protein